MRPSMARNDADTVAASSTPVVGAVTGNKHRPAMSRVASRTPALSARQPPAVAVSPLARVMVARLPAAGAVLTPKPVTVTSVDVAEEIDCATAVSVTLDLFSKGRMTTSAESLLAESSVTVKLMVSWRSKTGDRTKNVARPAGSVTTAAKVDAAGAAGSAWAFNTLVLAVPSVSGTRVTLSTRTLRLTLGTPTSAWSFKVTTTWQVEAPSAIKKVSQLALSMRTVRGTSGSTQLMVAVASPVSAVNETTAAPMPRHKKSKVPRPAASTVNTAVGSVRAPPAAAMVAMSAPSTWAMVAVTEPLPGVRSPFTLRTVIVVWSPRASVDFPADANRTGWPGGGGVTGQPTAINAAAASGRMRNR